MNDFEKILEKYKKLTGDNLEDLTESQINEVVSLAYEDGHSSGIEECADYMITYVSFARSILGLDV